MKKDPVDVNVSQLEEIIDRYLQSTPPPRYALKILGYPGVGKSSVVRQRAEKNGFHYVETRLAFKENVDLGGYPVPDEKNRRMVYYRPAFIPPENTPDGYEGVIWFLDEANRAHPTVIQTLFQIITERACGEHKLADRTCVILAGNLGEEDFTTITDFYDSALDGRLAVFHLLPDVRDWIQWATQLEDSGVLRIHPSIINYILAYPSNLWSRENIHPNPRGWEQVSQALRLSYHLDTEQDLRTHLEKKNADSLEKIIISLVGKSAGHDFLRQVLAPRKISSQEVLDGDKLKLQQLKTNEQSLPAEDVFWAIGGALFALKTADKKSLPELLANVLSFIAYTRADTALGFVTNLIVETGMSSRLREALEYITDLSLREDVRRRITALVREET